MTMRNWIILVATSFSLGACGDGETAKNDGTCPALEAPANGSVDDASRDPGDSATYGCDEGFMLSGGTSRVCQDDLAWSSAAPTCVVEHSCEKPGTATTTWVVSSLAFPGSNEVAGFDLDDHVTASDSDPVGCGVIDSAGGVDNAIAKTIELFGVVEPDFDFNAALGEAIIGGAVSIIIEMTGYDGPNDAFVTFSISEGGTPVAGAQDVCVSSDSMGTMQLDIPSLSIVIPDVDPSEGTPVPFPLHMSDVVVQISDPEGTPGVMIGGTAPWNAEVGGLHEAIQNILDAMVAGFSAQDTFGGLIDIGPDDACDRMSVGVSGSLSLAIQ